MILYILLYYIVQIMFFTLDHINRTFILSVDIKLV